MTLKFSGTDAASWVLSGVSSPKPVSMTHVRPEEPVRGNSENKEITDAVITMQNLMNQLGVELSKDVVAQNAAVKLNKPDSIRDILSKAKSFGTTGVGHKGGADGDWGKNTRNALLDIRQFVTDMGIQKVNINEGTGTSPLQTMQPKELLEAANANIHNLARVFDAVDIIPSIGAVGTDSMEVVDKIDPQLSDVGLSDPFGIGWGNFPVTKKDISDFMSFLNFVHRLKLSGCITVGELKESQKRSSYEPDLESLAREILDKTIFRFAQATAQVTDTPAVVPQTAQRAAGPCVNIIDQAIRWFYDRADAISRIMSNAADEALPNPRPDRVKGGVNLPVTSKHDSDLAKHYFAKMQSLSTDWDELRGKVINFLKSHSDPNDFAAVTRRVLVDATDDSRKSDSEKARTHQRSEEGGSHGHTIKNDDYGDTGAKGPISKFISLKRFPRDITDKISNLTINDDLPDLSFRQWTSYNWTGLSTWVAGATPPEQYARFGVWAESIKESLKSIFSNWRNEEDRPDDIVQQQWELLSQWIMIIDNKISRWRKEYRDRMAEWSAQSGRGH